MNVTLRFPSHPDIEPITVEAGDLSTVHLATATMESALAHLSPGAALEFFTITAIGGEDIEGTKLSEVLSASVEALDEHILTLTLLHDNHDVPVEAIQGWLALFGRLPRDVAEFDRAYKGEIDDLDCFANEDQVRQYNLDVTAPFYQAIDWTDAWERMGYAATHQVYNAKHNKIIFQRNT